MMMPKELDDRVPRYDLGAAAPAMAAPVGAVGAAAPAMAAPVGAVRFKLLSGPVKGNVGRTIRFIRAPI
jgi:hypothetical protein